MDFQILGDWLWKLLNSSIFGLITGFLLGQIPKFFGKIDIRHVPHLEQFPKEQFPRGERVDINTFIVDVINNKGMSVVIHNIKIKRDNREFRLFRSSERGLETDPINIGPHAGRRLILTMMQPIARGDKILLLVNGKNREITISND